MRDYAFSRSPSPDVATFDAFSSSPSPTRAFSFSPSPSPFADDITGMSDYPSPPTGFHRRAQSEPIVIPDDLTFDFLPPLSDDDISSYLDSIHFSPSPSPAELSVATTMEQASDEGSRSRHQRSQSMEPIERTSRTPSKRAIDLPDLALVDPKRAKRIWSNRQAAGRSKERKTRQIEELVQRMHTLQKETKELTIQSSIAQRDHDALTAENNLLKFRLESMEQKMNLQNALAETLDKEVNRLRAKAGEASFSSGKPFMNFGPPSLEGNQDYYHQNPAMQPVLAAHQVQQLYIHPQHQPQFHPQQQQALSNLELLRQMTSQAQREWMPDDNSGPKIC